MKLIKREKNKMLREKNIKYFHRYFNISAIKLLEIKKFLKLIILFLLKKRELRLTRNCIIL